MILSCFHWKTLALKCPGKYREVSISLTPCGTDIAFCKIIFVKITCLIWHLPLPNILCDHHMQIKLIVCGYYKSVTTKQYVILVLKVFQPTKERKGIYPSTWHLKQKLKWYFVLDRENKLLAIFQCSHSPKQHPLQMQQGCSPSPTVTSPSLCYSSVPWHCRHRQWWTVQHSITDHTAMPLHFMI